MSRQKKLDCRHPDLRNCIHTLRKEIMKKDHVSAAITAAFKTQVQKDPRLRNAYLLVASEQLGIDILLAENGASSTPVHPMQPIHMASVGKIFTATLTGILKDLGKLDFSDPIALHLDAELMKGLHVHRGIDYSDQITVTHLLQQSSGLGDVFFPLWKKLKKGGPSMSAREAVIWGKRQSRPKFPPGAGNHYGDTNYYLLGLIIESVSGKPFHEAMSEYVFDPLGMDQAYVFGFSGPSSPQRHPMAKVHLDGTDIDAVPEVYRLDYAGGGVVAPLSQYHTFLKALLDGRLVSPETLDRMLNDTVRMGFPTIGFDYGYSIWKFRAIPVLLPKELVCWGCVGITGAFLFYHPPTGACIIGSFNDMAYKSKSLRFMLFKVIKPLLALARQAQNQGETNE